MAAEVMAVDTPRRWLLMRDMGTKTLDSVPDLEQWKEAVHAYAHLQVDWVDGARRFAIAGCPNRGLLQLVPSIERLRADTVAMKPGTPDGLSMMQIHALHYRARALKIAAHRLGTLRLPVSLDHGDLWPVRLSLVTPTPCSSTGLMHPSRIPSSRWPSSPMRKTCARRRTQLPYMLSCRRDRSPDRADLQGQPTIPALLGTFVGG